MSLVYYFPYLCHFSGQLNECSHRLEKLQQELARYTSYLEDCIKGIQSGGQNNLSAGGSPLVNGSSRHHRSRRGSGGSGDHRGDDESLSRSESDSSVINGGGSSGANNRLGGKVSAPGTPRLNHG